MRCWAARKAGRSAADLSAAICARAGLDGRRAGFLRGGFVHAGVEEIADFLLISGAPGRYLSGFIEKAPRGIAGYRK